MLKAKALEPIQMLWVRGDLSRMELLSLRSFLAQGHPVHLYTYTEPSNVPEGVVVKDAAAVVSPELAPSANKVPFGKGSMGAFSDYFRYQLLYQRGGWWCDMDVVAIKSWTGFPEFVAASTHELGYGRIANGYALRANPGDQVLGRCLDALKDKKLSELDISDTGPLLLNEVLGPEGVRRHCQQPEVFGPVPWNAGWQLLRPLLKRFTIEELKQRIRRPHLSMRFTKNTVAVHLWNETWRAAGWSKAERHDPTCLYEKLHRKYNSEG
jgi:hypothetical protein